MDRETEEGREKSLSFSRTIIADFYCVGEEKWKRAHCVKMKHAVISTRLKTGTLCTRH